ncbi:MAG: HAD family hydrolase [candidate division Zixibacteria bacterium]|nr:HAD family hydrolase [candidate division Zixibacteria bacterium]
MSHAISWIFFDIGNVLFNDDLAMARTWEIVFDEIRRTHPTVTFADLMAEREYLIQEEGDGGSYRAVARKYLGDERFVLARQQVVQDLDRHYLKYHRLYAGVHDLLKELSSQYHLATAANQVRSCRDVLEQCGIADYFALHWLSDEVGLAKPDPKFLTALLEKTGCDPAEAVMVGDRIDYDIEPANRLGLHTVHVKHKRELELDPNLTEPARLYLSSLSRVSVSDVTPALPDQYPDAVVHSLQDIPAAVAALAHS